MGRVKICRYVTSILPPNDRDFITKNCNLWLDSFKKAKMNACKNICNICEKWLTLLYSSLLLILDSTRSKYLYQTPIVILHSQTRGVDLLKRKHGRKHWNNFWSSAICMEVVLRIHISSLFWSFWSCWSFLCNCHIIDIG